MTFSKDAGKKPGLEIWRIEKMEPVPVDPKTYGSFHTGDCYLVLKTTEKKGAVEQDLHFWLGEESSQDEKGAAAYHTVALDDQLGGRPVQYREVQGAESAKFLSIFPKGIEYLQGGVASGFKKVDHTVQSELFHLKGKRNVRVAQVKPVVASLNDGDVFVLLCNDAIFQWNGKEANRYEKTKGLEYIQNLKAAKGAYAKLPVIALDSGKNDDEKAEGAKFWKALGGKAAVKSAQDGGDDAESGRPRRLFAVNGDKLELAGESKLERKSLDSNGVFVLDDGVAVTVWVGKGSGGRKTAFKMAEQYLQQEKLPATTAASVVTEGAETTVFKSQFFMWDPPRVKGPEAKKQEDEPINVALLHKRQAAEEKMVDEAKGHIDVWRIENFAKVAVPKEKYGEFFSGDSYIILYTYKSNNRDKWIIYFWQGQNSSSDEKGASALLTKQMDDDMGGEPVQVRVVQGKEPNHFLALFKGGFVVHAGGHASAFKNRKDTDTFNAEGTALYHVRGTSPFNTRAVATDPSAGSLNSGDCFVLLASDNAFVWNGEGSSDSERKVASTVAGRLAHGRKVVSVDEGSESDDFWAALGGKAEYARGRALSEGAHDPRLFRVSTAISRHSGPVVEEIVDFNQDDLVHDDVMILDTFDEVYVWIGHESNKKERENALAVALEYVKTAPDGRSADTPVYKVLAGNEPPTFTCHFLGWDAAKASNFVDPYQAKLGQVAKKGEEKEQVKVASVGAAPAPITSFHSYDDIVAGKVAGLDTTRKEQYLSDADFQKIFGMDKAKFAAQPLWKQTAAKKDKKLF